MYALILIFKNLVNNGLVWSKILEMTEKISYLSILFLRKISQEEIAAFKMGMVL